MDPCEIPVSQEAIGGEEGIECRREGNRERFIPSIVFQRDGKIYNLQASASVAGDDLTRLIESFRFTR